MESGSVNNIEGLIGKWYYLNNSGDMETGWEQVNGKWYFFYASGEMPTNTKVGG